MKIAMAKHICTKCQGEMEKGFIAAKTASGREVRADWGTNISFLGTGMDNIYPVTTYRCKKCGILENFAI